MEKMGKSLLKIFVLLLFLFIQLSYSLGEKYTSIVVSKEVNEQNGTILFNITVLYFNTSRIEISFGFNPQIVEHRNVTSVENATVYVSFYNTSYTENGTLVQTLSPLPCSPVITNETYEEDGKVVYYGVCAVGGELYSKYFNNTCTGFDFYFPGMSLPNDSIPPTETTLNVCAGKPTIFEAFRGVLATAIDPTNPFCVSMFIIFGLLLATLFFTGRSPLALLDMVTPILPKPRRFRYTAGVYGIRHKQMKEAAEKAIKAVDKEIKAREKKVKIPENLRSLYEKAEPWRKILALKALKDGNVELAGRILDPNNNPFDVAVKRWGEKDEDVGKAYLYHAFTNLLGAYDKIFSKVIPQRLKWMGKFWPTAPIVSALGSAAMTVRMAARIVAAPFIRRGELKRIKAVEKARTPEEREAALKDLEKYREKKKIEPVNRLLDPLGIGEGVYKRFREVFLDEITAYVLLKVFEKAGIERKRIEKIFKILQEGIAKNREWAVKKALAGLKDVIAKINEIDLDPRYENIKNIINSIRNLYAGEGDPYAKVRKILSIAEREKIIVGDELAQLKRYIRELSQIDRREDLLDIQKFLEAAFYIKNYRDKLPSNWSGFIPSLFTPETERKNIPIISMLFAHELLSQARANISDVVRLFSLRIMNALFPLMEYNLLPDGLRKRLESKELKLDGVYRSISSFSSQMFDQLAEQLAEKAGLNVADLMKNYHVRNKFALLTTGVFGRLNLNTGGEWHIFSPHWTVGKTGRITASAFGRALELAYLGKVKENFKDAFRNEAFMKLFSYYSVATKNFVNDDAFQLASVGYYSIRHYVAKKLGIDVSALTDEMLKNFLSNKKNLDLYATDLERGSFILMKGYGVIPFIQDVLNPDQLKLDKYFVDEKIREYIRGRLGYNLTSPVDCSAVYSKLVAKGGIGLPDSFINTMILVNVNGKFRLWKGGEVSEGELYKLDKKIAERGELEPGKFVELYRLAASGDKEAFEKVREILKKNEIMRMDIFMTLANAYQLSTKDAVARSEIFKGITAEQHVKYLPMQDARKTVNDWKDKVRLRIESWISGALKPVVYANIPYWKAMGDIVAISEVARRLGVEYVGSVTREDLEKLTWQERRREMEFIKAVKEFEHQWQWTITRDALLYGGFERYGRPGYLTTGFHVGPAMPVTNWMDRRSFGSLGEGIPILDRVMQSVALTTYKLSVAFSRPFVLGARAITFHRYRYPSPYDIRSDIAETNPFVPTQAYYPVYSTLPGGARTQLLRGFSIFAVPLLVIPAFIKEMRERKELPSFYWERLRPEEKVVQSPGEGHRGITLPRGYVFRGGIMDAIRNSIVRAHEWAYAMPTSIKRLGIADSEIYTGAPRGTDIYWFYSPFIANIGDADTNPGLSYIQSYTGNYVWQPLVPRMLERRGMSLLPRVREHMFDVHEKRTISALGLAAFYYSEVHWADPFNFKDNPLYPMLSPGTFLAFFGAPWVARGAYGMVRSALGRIGRMRSGRGEEARAGGTEAAVQQPAELPPQQLVGSPVSQQPADYTVKWGGIKVFNAVRNWVVGRMQRWLLQKKLNTCPNCHIQYVGSPSEPCPRCGHKPR